MTKYFFIENGIINGCGEINRLDENVENIEVDDETYSTYITTPSKFMYKDGKIIQNPEYEKQIQQAAINEEISMIKIKLEDIDKKRVRAICENSIKDEQQNQTWLEYYNEEAKNLRNKISKLNEKLSK